ncbi:MAG TPA: GNAT family N-acetyltransferase [Thermodesulfobacteriota bacterium]|nr:GNAT family N-acetyltransferase [Thermodesulfobacteriota bacterium]
MTDPQGNDFYIEHLDSHDRSSFSCGVEELDIYLKTRASQDARKKVAAPFVVIDETNGTVAGFYTLSMKSVKLAELQPEAQKKLPRYPEVPAVLLGRMGIDVKYRGRGLGEIILFDALKRSYEHSGEIAAFAVVVDAKHGAEGFYLRYGFVPFPDDKYQLFLPMKTIETLIKES